MWRYCLPLLILVLGHSGGIACPFSLLSWATDTAVYKLHLAGYKWNPGTTHCGKDGPRCSCYDVEDYSEEPILYDLIQDPYEDNPIPADSKKYAAIVALLLQFQAEWRERVPYPPSLFHNVPNMVLSPWLQPLRSIS
ncbi:hypothetical protein GWK47_000594 [Chionoecetes opilio]|uniref:Uncharacterized protein n=1 Tax=Chionoecetes opilio TaxID=41210 RepID=A0A8J4Y913_CHIOP|nr:hypothetical protein GWK47_000594 [Chionoecetes opilio]